MSGRVGSRECFLPFYLHPPGQTGWIEAQDQLVAGIGATGWLKDKERSNLCEEVCAVLTPKWIAGELYHLNRSYLNKVKSEVIRAERFLGEKHGKAKVTSFIKGYENQLEARHPHLGTRATAFSPAFECRS